MGIAPNRTVAPRVAIVVISGTVAVASVLTLRLLREDGGQPPAVTPEPTAANLEPLPTPGQAAGFPPPTPHALPSLGPPPTLNVPEVMATEAVPFMPTIGTPAPPIPAVEPGCELSLELVGQYGGAPIVGIHAWGEYAFVGVGQRMAVVDVGEPERPVEVASTVVGDLLRAMTADGGLVFLVDERGTLHVIDISDPLRPYEAGSVELGVTSAGVLVTRDGFAYVLADREDGHDGVSNYRTVSAVDVRDPTAPLLLSNRNVPGASDIAVGQGKILMTDSSGLVVHDLVAPGEFTESARFGTDGPATGIDLRSGVAFVAAGSTLHVIDVSEPGDPKALKALRFEADEADWWDGDPAMIEPKIRDVLVVGDRAVVYGASFTNPLQGYLADFRLLDVVQPSDPIEVGRIRGLHAFGSVELLNERLYLSESHGGLLIYDVTEPGEPTRLGFRYLVPQDVWAIASADGYAYLADASLTVPRGRSFSQPGLWVVDVSDPSKPRLVSFLGTEQLLSDVAVGPGGYVYAVNWKLHVVDVSNPIRPRLVGEVEASEELAHRVAVAGEHAYVLDDAALYVIDVSEPSEPRRVATVGAPAHARDLVLDGGHAYVIGGHDKIMVLDVRDPTRALEVAMLNLPFSDPYTWNGGLDVDGGVLAAGSLRLFDVAEPWSPRDLGHWAAPLGQSTGMSISGGYLYAQDGWATLRAYDLSTPELPRDAGAVDVPGEVKGIAPHGEFVYVAVNYMFVSHAGFAVVRTSDPNGCLR